MEPASILISPTIPDMVVGETLQLTVAVFDENGEPYTGPEPITYKSYTPNICSVSNTGLVTALASEIGLIEVACGGRRGGTFPKIRN